MATDDEDFEIEVSCTSANTKSIQNESGDELMYSQHLENIGFIPIQNDSASYESQSLSEMSVSDVSTEVMSDASLNFSPPYIQHVKDIQNAGFVNQEGKSLPSQSESYKEKSKNIFTLETPEKVKNKFLVERINKLKLYKPLASVIREDTTSEQKENFLTKKLLMLEKETDEKYKFDPSSSIYRKSSLSVVSIPSLWLERIRLAKLFHDLQKLKTQPIHSPKSCAHCRGLLKIHDQTKVMKRLVGRVQAPLIEEKIQEHIINYTSINLIGEASRSLPRLSDFNKI